MINDKNTYIYVKQNKREKIWIITKYINQINHQLRLRLTSISFCMQRFGASLWMAIASAKPNDLLLLARYRILKAFCGSTVCRVSAKCFVIALFGTPVLFCWSHLGICSATRVHKVLVVRPMYLHPQDLS